MNDYVIQTFDAETGETTIRPMTTEEIEQLQTNGYVHQREVPTE